jgi:hypothetical protein
VVSDEDPRRYIPELIGGLGDSAEAVFRSNALPLPSQFHYEVATFEEFMGERCGIISDLVEHLCQGAMVKH